MWSQELRRRRIQAERVRDQQCGTMLRSRVRCGQRRGHGVTTERVPVTLVECWGGSQISEVKRR